MREARFDTYGGADAVAPELDFEVVTAYLVTCNFRCF